jgi:large subunit ribosomal protein L22
VVQEGPRLRRFWPRARGSAGPVLKRLCHVRIVLTDGKEGDAA